MKNQTLLWILYLISTIGIFILTRYQMIIGEFDFLFDSDEEY